MLMFSALGALVSGAPQQVFFDNVESGANGWNNTGLWHQETYRYNSSVASWTYNRGSPSYNYNTGARNSGYLTSPTINLAGYGSATLYFDGYYQTETTGTWYDRRLVQISVNGGAFTNLGQLSGDVMNRWNPYQFNLNSYAGNQVRLRFFFDTIDSWYNNYWGWSIDDINVTAEVTDSQPVAAANAVPTFGAAPLTVNFTGQVSGGNAPLTYSWDFKDGFTSTNQNPQHNFTNVGTYNVSFTVTDADNDVSTSYKVITVSNFDFSISVSPISGSVAQARDASTDVTLTLLGGTSESVSLSQAGCPAFTTCSFNPTSGAPTYSSTLIIATTGSTPAGNYLITVNGTSIGGLKRLTTYNLTVTDSRPLASPGANPATGTAPLEVSFTGVFTGGDSPFTYSWDFKDGFTSTNQNPQHIFSSAGWYNVSFTVTDFDGDANTGAVMVIVN